MDEEAVRMRLRSAERRLADLAALNGGYLAGADLEDRIRTNQEFFFHLCGAVDALAQHVTAARGLNLGAEDVSVAAVLAALPTGTPLEVAFSALRMKTRCQPVPSDPYTDDACVFRAFVYRHQVTHRHRNPIVVTLDVGADNAEVFLLLDPRNNARGRSAAPILAELRRMLDLVTQRCEAALAAV